MKHGWWKISKPDHLTEVTDSLHQRGVREGELKRNLVKHLEAAVEASVSVSILRLLSTELKLNCISNFFSNLLCVHMSQAKSVLRLHRTDWPRLVRLGCQLAKSSKKTLA